jgi:hypothetical protein
MCYSPGSSPRRFRCVFGFLALTLLGCGSSGPYGLQKVSGKVIYEDGSVIPAARIEIKFQSLEPPKDAQTHPRPGVVEVNTADGSFQDVSTYDFGDGAIRGRHKVVIMAMDAQNVPIAAIPFQYCSVDTTPLEVDTADSPFEFKVPKP